MSSLVTNNAAMAALQSLRAVSADLDQTQRQTATGLRISQASDNAAYWSIATTMRSDKGAISAVSDAIGLGAAKVDVAYQGLSSTTDLLSQFADKLVAAKEESVDKTKVQAELDQLKQQISSVSSSASFAGANWLNTDITDMYDQQFSTTTVASSFVRNSDGTVEVKDQSVDLSKISLLNSTGDGLLQTDTRNIGDIGGLRDVSWDSSGQSGQQLFTWEGPATFSASDSLSFDYTVDGSSLAAGTTYHVAIDKSIVDDALGTTDGIISSPKDWEAVLAKADDGLGFPYDPSRGGGMGLFYNVGGNTSVYGFWSPEMENLPGSSVRVTNVSSTLNGSNFAFGLENGPSSTTDGGYATLKFNFGDSFQLKTDVDFSFDITLDRSDKLGITVTRDDVNSALGVTDGKVTSASDMATVLNAVLLGKGLHPPLTALKSKLPSTQQCTQTWDTVLMLPCRM